MQTGWSGLIHNAERTVESASVHRDETSAQHQPSPTDTKTIGLAVVTGCRNPPICRDDH